MSEWSAEDNHIRGLRPDDLPEVTSIFNASVEAGEATIDAQPRTVEQMTAWLTSDRPAYESYVYAQDGVIVGWAAITRYHEREAYSPTAELSVFVKQAARRAGVGRRLMRKVLERAEQLGFHSAVVIIRPEPTYIIEAVQSLGFTELGRLRGVLPAGDSWSDIVLLQRLFKRGGDNA